MYNNYLEDIISINSEFIYESILIESNMFTSMIQKIKQLWDKFLNFLRKIKNAILSLIKKGKKDIVESEAMIKPIDYTEHIEKLKNINKLLEENKLTYDNIENFVDSFSFQFDYNIISKDVNGKTILTKVTIKEAVKTLELRITQAEKLMERTKNLLDEKIISRAQREIESAEKENNDTKINENKAKLNKIMISSNKIISNITNFIMQLKKDVEYCYKQSKGELTNLPKGVDISDIQKIENSVEDAREWLTKIVFRYYSVMSVQQQINKLKFLLSHAEKFYGDKIYEPDKKVENEEDILNKLNIEYIKKNEVSKEEFNSARHTIEKALNNNFSKRRVTYIVNNYLMSYDYLFKKVDKK